MQEAWIPAQFGEFPAATYLLIKWWIKPGSLEQGKSLHSIDELWTLHWPDWINIPDQREGDDRTNEYKKPSIVTGRQMRPPFWSERYKVSLTSRKQRDVCLKGACPRAE